MPRWVTLVSLGVVVGAAGPARAEQRVALEIPDLTLLETVFHLDRGQDYQDRTRSALHGSIALGAGNDGAETVATEAVGWRNGRVLAAIGSELATADLGLVRGHHRGLVELRDEELGVVLAVRGDLDYGHAMGLARAPLGGGRRVNADAALDGAVRLGSEHGDFTWVGEIHGDAGETRWIDAPVDRAIRHALGLGLGQMTFDGEIPRGTIDVVRGRVEDIAIQRPFAAAGAGSLDAHLRIVELGLGTNQLTLHIDHELLAVLDGDLGWSWLESEHAATSGFRMRLGTAIAMRGEHEAGERRIGAHLSRTPTYTPDGQLASEWRAELELARETERWLAGARGGISWLSPLDAPGRTSLRYATQLDAFLRAIAGLEVGVYVATAFQPLVAGDPWATPRAWSTETGVLVRVRR